MMTQDQKVKGLKPSISNPIKITDIINTLKNSSIPLLSCQPENGGWNKVHKFPSSINALLRPDFISDRTRHHSTDTQ